MLCPTIAYLPTDGQFTRALKSNRLIQTPISKTREGLMLRRRSLLTAAVAVPFVPAAPFVARAAETPGVTASEIRIGSMAAYSGPASAYSAIGRAHTATFRWLNDQGASAGAR